MTANQYPVFLEPIARPFLVAYAAIVNASRGLACVTRHAKLAASLWQQPAWLKISSEAHGDAPGRADGIAGEKAAEVDHIDNIIEVLPVDLKNHLHAV